MQYTAFHFDAIFFWKNKIQKFDFWGAAIHDPHYMLRLVSLHFWLLNMSGNTAWPQALGLQIVKTNHFFGIFNELLSTQIVIFEVSIWHFSPIFVLFGIFNERLANQKNVSIDFWILAFLKFWNFPLIFVPL